MAICDGPTLQLLNKRNGVTELSDTLGKFLVHRVVVVLLAKLLLSLIKIISTLL